MGVRYGGKIVHEKISNLLIFGVCDDYFYDSRNVYYMRAAGENFRTLGLLNTNF